jgi:hypothetical protein
LLQQGRNQRGDGFFFVETGDDGGAVHKASLAETFASSKSGSKVSLYFLGGIGRYLAKFLTRGWC